VESGARGDVSFEFSALGGYEEVDRFFQKVALSHRLVDVERLTLTATTEDVVQLAAVLRFPYWDVLAGPDFVVETKREKFLCEPKGAAEMEDREVLAKAKAAAEWCGYATEHEGKNGGKPWTYLLIPHDVITENKTLKGLAASYMHRGEDRTPR